MRPHPHPHFSVFILRTGPVRTGGDGRSGGGTGRAQGKSSSPLGGTGSWQGLRPPCVPTVSTVPCNQQLNQGNAVPIL